MPAPLEICLEELDGSVPDEPYIRCVALPGGEPGLALDREGAVRWMPAEATSHGLRVSADDRLILVRGAAAAPIVVNRAGRSLEAPPGKPVVLLDQDLLLLHGRRLRVHVHGPTEQPYPPERLSRSALGRVARAAAAALAIGAAVGGSEAPVAASTPIEVRDQPPEVSAVRQVSCKVTAVPKGKAGAPALIHAECPSGAKLKVGQRGNLLDSGGRHLKDGEVVIKELKGTRLVGEVKRLPANKPATVLFYVHG